MVISRPNILWIKFLYFLSPIIPNKIYLQLLFPLIAGYKLNLREPKTYNEKLQWLKLNYRKPVLSLIVDKYAAKKYVRNKVGEKYIIHNYGVWDSFNEIDFKILPQKFVLKTTHDQGGVIICRDKSQFDYNKAKKKLTKHLRHKHYYLSREWPYKNVPPQIIAEELLEDTEKQDVWDYKFFCFHGEPKAMYISMGRQGNHVPFYTYDMDFNLLDLQRPGHEHNGEPLNKPTNWGLMKEMAKALSQNLPHVRIDFYEINKEIKVGEFTLFHGGGMMPFIPKEWDDIFGSWINLNNLK